MDILKQISIPEFPEFKKIETNNSANYFSFSIMIYHNNLK